MGISLFVGEESDEQEFRLCNAEWYARFLDYVATKNPPYENLLHFAPNITYGVKGFTGDATTEQVSLEDLKGECVSLLTDEGAPDFVHDIVAQFVEAIDLCVQQNEVLTMD